MAEIGVFAAKVLILVLAVGLIAMIVAVLSAKSAHTPELEVEALHKKFKNLTFYLQRFSMNKSELKKLKKKLKDDAKKEEKLEATKKVFVLNFKGDRDAGAAENLREEVTAILQLASSSDEVVAVIESPGGTVHGYGFAASQLLRIREHGVQLVIAIDKVAASGGYMMACVGHRILAAPFALVGSIGVAAPVPNLHRLLKKHDVDFKEYTAGDYKRTVSLLGEVTPRGEAKFQEQIEQIHGLFKEFVGRFRPQLNLTQIATGEYWLGSRALELGLVDEIATSDEYLLKKYAENLPIYAIKFEAKQKFMDRLSGLLSLSAANTFTRLINALERRLFL